jgi:hypothetical protein
MNKRWIGFFSTNDKTSLTKDKFLIEFKRFHCCISNMENLISEELQHAINTAAKSMIVKHMGNEERKKILISNLAKPCCSFFSFFTIVLITYLKLLSYFDLQLITMIFGFVSLLLFLISCMSLFKNTILINENFINRLKNNCLVIGDIFRLIKLNNQMNCLNFSCRTLEELLKSDCFLKISTLLFDITRYPDDMLLKEIPDAIEEAYQQVTIAIINAEDVFHQNDDSHLQNDAHIDGLISSFSHGF